MKNSLKVFLKVCLSALSIGGSSISYANMAGESGLYMNERGTIFFSAGNGVYCGYWSASMFEMASGDWAEARSHRINDLDLYGMTYAGGCPVPNVPRGFFDFDGSPGILWSDGKSYCHVVAPEYVNGPVKNYDFNILAVSSSRSLGDCPH